MQDLTFHDQKSSLAIQKLMDQKYCNTNHGNISIGHMGVVTFPVFIEIITILVSLCSNIVPTSSWFSANVDDLWLYLRTTVRTPLRAKVTCPMIEWALQSGGVLLYGHHCEPRSPVPDRVGTPERRGSFYCRLTDTTVCQGHLSHNGVGTPERRGSFYCRLTDTTVCQGHLSHNGVGTPERRGSFYCRLTDTTVCQGHLSHNGVGTPERRGFIADLRTPLCAKVTCPIMEWALQSGGVLLPTVKRLISSGVGVK